MATRNFWINAEIDGRETPLAGGPRSKDGGMDVLLTVREDGGISDGVRITCRSDGEKNVIRVWGPDGEKLYEREYLR
jgi:hypothetical protein